MNILVISLPHTVKSVRNVNAVLYKIYKTCFLKRKSVAVEKRPCMLMKSKRNLQIENLTSN